MTPFWSDDHLTLYGGDCRTVLAELPAQSVHTVVTSPPYWGLRDYGTATWDGGDPACDHSGVRRPGPDDKSFTNGGTSRDKPRDTCRKCGAVRIDSQLGLEATPEEFVANMVAVFREVRRVLRDDGTLWLNLGDSYNNRNATRKSSHQGGLGFSSDDLSKSWVELRAEGRTRMSIEDGDLKEKDLVGIPWMVAFALRADGWYLRSDIIWAKPNPMPESVTDRPTKAHEYLFLLTKSPRYYYDADAVREPSPDNKNTHWRASKYDSSLGTIDNGASRRPEVTLGRGEPTLTKNLRTVWTIATEPYPGAHFATFPRKLVEPCVKAGTSERGVCPECGAPWVREVERTPMVIDRSERTHSKGQTRASGSMVSPPVYTDKGWRPSCAHDAEPVPATVLDPFAGSGTTLLVAQSLGRKGVGIDLSPEYLKQALARNAQTPLGLVG